MDMMDMGAQPDQQQQETLERERYEQATLKLVGDALLGPSPAWLARAKVELDGREAP